MNRGGARFVSLGVSLVALMTLGWVLTGQAARPAKHRISLATDWSHRHLIFSQPATAEATAQAAEDPRYWQQAYRRQQRMMLPIELPYTAGGWRHRKIHRDWSEFLGSGGTLPANFFPAKYSFDLTKAHCASDPSPDFTVFSTGLVSSATQASIVAFDNLYSGCSGTKPTVYWAYDTGGQILTSPVLSLDGSQIMFVQTNGGIGFLVLLKWAASTTETVTSPITPTVVASNAYRACTAPCMTSITLRDGSGVATDDKTSSPFYDYAHDIAWVGGELGWLHKLTGVFNGTPAEVATAVFPVHLRVGLTGGSALSSPVYDHRTVNVFVGDASGYLYSVDATIGSFVQSAQLDHGVGIVDSPVVDSAGQFVYAFASSDGSAGCVGSVDCAAVYALSTHFTTGDAGNKTIVGASTTFPTAPNPLYAGGFDSSYITSQTGTGNLYVCGNTGGPPILYQVPIAAGVPGTAKNLPFLSNITPAACSPVTDIQNPDAANGPKEWIFVSSQADGVSTPCGGGGCIYNFKVTPWTPNTLYALNAEVLDSNLNIQAVTNVTGGRSGSSEPAWNTTIQGGTTDGTGITAVEWQDLGPLSSVTRPAWLNTHAYIVGNIILDNQNNYERCNVAGTTGGSVPAWNPNTGGTTIDGSVHWINLGPNPDAALAATGGTTGVIMDNIVSSGTLAGASQVYFSTLGSQICATSGGNGNCAVQASQPGLN